MKTPLLLISFILGSWLGFQPGPSLARAEGGSVSGGADYHADAKAWFTSDDLSKTVHACIQSDPTFGIPLSELKAVAEKSFRMWSDYYHQVGADIRSDETGEWTGLNYCLKKTEKRIGYRIATKIEVREFCDGTEDLTLFFGIENTDLLARKAHYNFPFAFAELTQSIPIYGYQQAWSKGLIWIAPPLSDPDRKVPAWTNYGHAPLEMVVLHEMGHVFGNEHIQGTIMDAKIADRLRELTDITHRDDRREKFNSLELRIERSNFLVFRPELAMNLPLGPPNTCKKNDETCLDQAQATYRSIFKSLTGIDLQDRYFDATIVKAASPFSKGNFNELYPVDYLTSEIHVRADGNDLVLNFKADSVDFDKEYGMAFQDGCRYFGHKSYSIGGTITRVDGSKKSVALNVNGWGQIQIVDLDKTTPYCTSMRAMGLRCILLSIDSERLKD